MPWLAIAATVVLLALVLRVSGQGSPLLGLALLVLLIVVALLAGWRIQRWRARAPQPPANASAAAKAHATPMGDNKAPEDERATALAIVLAEAVVLSAGRDADAWQALKEVRVRPSLDPELRDVDGLPVFTARVPELDVSGCLHNEIDASLRGGLPWPQQALRTLALLEGPLVRLMEALHALDANALAGTQAADDPREAWGDALPHSLPLDAPSHLSGVGLPGRQARLQRRAAHAPVLAVRLWLPGSWDAEIRSAAVAWLRSRCGPLLDWADRHGAAPPVWLTEPLAPDASPQALWEEVSAHWQQGATARPQLMLLLAADTAVDEEQVMSWQARGELFTSHHQRGRVPGEAAAGLLLTNAAWQQWMLAEPDSCAKSGDASGVGMHADGLQEAMAACPRLWRPAMQQRERSADVVGRVNSAVLQALMHQATPAASQPEHEWLLVSDADHRASRTVEIFEALQTVRPQADPMTSVVRVGDACGDMGLAGALVPVALAASALRQGEPVDLAMALLVQDSLQRVVVPLTLPSFIASPTTPSPSAVQPH